MENLVLLAGKWSSLRPCGLAPWDKCILVESQQIQYTFFPFLCHVAGTCCSEGLGQAMEALRLVSFAALVGTRGSCTAELDSGSAFHKVSGWTILCWFKGSVVSFPPWRESGDVELLPSNSSVLFLERMLESIFLLAVEWAPQISNRFPP